MKVVIPKQSTMTAKAPLLPLVPDKNLDVLTKQNSCSYELYSDPTDNTSAKYKVQVRILDGSESARVIIRWKKDVYKVVRGLGVTTTGNMIRIAETMMRDTPLTLFQSKITVLAEAAYDRAMAACTTDAQRNTVTTNGVDHYRSALHFEAALCHTVQNLLPKKILQKVKRYLRRECRKPADMKIRTYFQHLTRINVEEIPDLPPFNQNQELQQDELVDILLYAVPRSWSREADRQGFECVEHTPKEVVDFLEQIETAEEFDGKEVTKKNGKQKEGSSKEHSKSNEKGGKKFCLVHGYNTTHATDACKKLQAEAKCLKADSPHNKDGGRSSGNKTWSRRAEDAKKKTQKDLAAYVAKQVKKEVASFTKKRKNEEDEASVHNIEEIDLSGFNYTDMDNLKIDSDDEISV